MIKINGNKLRALLALNKIHNLDNASIRLGYGHSYLSNTINKELISPQATILIETVFGVKLDDYIKIDEPKEPQKKPIEISYSRLEECIYRAVKRALEDN